MLTSVSSVQAMTMKTPSRSLGAGVLAPLPGDRALGGERLELGAGLGRDERHVAVAGEQALDLLQADLAAADDQAAPPVSFRHAM